MAVEAASPVVVKCKKNIGWDAILHWVAPQFQIRIKVCIEVNLVLLAAHGLRLLSIVGEQIQKVEALRVPIGGQILSVAFFELLSNHPFRRRPVSPAGEHKVCSAVCV